MKALFWVKTVNFWYLQVVDGRGWGALKGLCRKGNTLIHEGSLCSYSQITPKANAQCGWEHLWGSFLPAMFTSYCFNIKPLWLEYTLTKVFVVRIKVEGGCFSEVSWELDEPHGAQKNVVENSGIGETQLRISGSLLLTAVWLWTSHCKKPLFSHM